MQQTRPNPLTLLGMELSPGKASIPYVLAILGGALSSILGALVLTAWYTHNVTLLQLWTAFVPMQFNSALGFLLSGLGLLLVGSGRHTAGTLCGIFVLLTGLRTIAEYILGIDLGVDQLLMKHYITIQTSPPGRMAPDTALCFSLTGAALIVLGTRANVWKPPMIAGTLGSLILGLGLVALAGYAFSLETVHGWGKLTSMAVQTAGGFILLGVGITSLAWHRGASILSRLPPWLPVPVGIGVMTVTISLWQALASQQAQLIRKYGISEDHFSINDVFLVVGILLAAALSLAAYLAQSAKNREREAEAANRGLAAEIDERKMAEKANLAKSAFLANMSHEIRTPINAIVGLTYVMQQTGPTAEQAQHLDRIGACTLHLLAIIDDILDLAKIESGKLSLEQSDFHLDAILDHVQSLFKVQTRSKGLFFKVETNEVPHWLRGDLTRLRQALINYIGNAIKFTEQGTIFLRARKLEEHGDEILVRFEVQDTGIGIGPDKLIGLFEPFVQGDVSTTRKYGGTGLGLVITRRLARLMGGEAGATSEPGRGSTFWFTARLGRGHGTLPAAPSTGVAGAKTELRPHYRGSRILLAEDNAINREVTLALLGTLGLAVDTAENGRKAVAKVRASDYDLILMDVQMPEMDGLEATRMIRSMTGKEDLPILAMTGAVFEEDRQACLEAGMSDFIAKPIDMKKMFSTLARWLPEQAPAPNLQG